MRVSHTTVGCGTLHSIFPQTLTCPPSPYPHPSHLEWCSPPSNHACPVMSLPWKPTEPIKSQTHGAPIPAAPISHMVCPGPRGDKAGTSYLPHFLQGKVFSWFWVLLNASGFFFSVKGSALRDFPGPSLGFSEV